MIPGVAAALLVMFGGFALADALGHAILAIRGLPDAASPISGVPVAIVLGLLLHNLVGLPAFLEPGLRFSTTTILRLGIVLVGIRLSLGDVVRLGIGGVPVVVAAITAGLLFVTWFNRRLGLPPRLGILIAAGTSICGVTAIVSTAPAIHADEREVAYAVANVVAFGLLGMLFYPYFAHAMLPGPTQIGLFLGTAVHDTSQVVGAALSYKQLYGDDLVLRVATVTKLTRNLFLAAVIPALTWWHLRSTDAAGTGGARPVARPWTSYVPPFVLGFVAMVVVRSLGNLTLDRGGEAFGLWDSVEWARITSVIGDTLASQYLLGTAMAGVGLSTSFSVFKGVGPRPFIVGFMGALFVGAIGLTMALVFGRFVQL